MGTFGQKKLWFWNLPFIPNILVANYQKIFRVFGWNGSSLFGIKCQVNSWWGASCFKGERVGAGRIRNKSPYETPFTVYWFSNSRLFYHVWHRWNIARRAPFAKPLMLDCPKNKIECGDCSGKTGLEFHSANPGYLLAIYRWIWMELTWKYKFHQT